MIKGINKQIIEIRCTNDEYFEKALLFVRAEKTDEPPQVIRDCAQNYCRSMQLEIPDKRRRKRNLVTGILLALLAVSAVSALIIITAT